MSELLVNTIKKADGTGSLSVPAESGTVVTTASPSLGRRNLIINGAMQVAQRGTSSTAGGYNTVDRFELNKNNLDQMGTTTTQSPDAPTGFANALKVVGSPAETAIAADERVYFRYKFEGQNLQQLKKGTADAVSVTLSFWVKSDVTGNYAVKLEDTDNTRSIGSTYTINAADTWEYKTLTFAGDTTGTLNNDNNISLRIDWYLMAGSDYTSTDNTSWGAHVTGKSAYGHTASFGTTDNDNWQITGVQLEVGSVATPFEHRSYGEELALCQRYYFKHTVSQANDSFCVGMMEAPANSCFGDVKFAVPMRSDPTALETTGTATDYEIRVPGATVVCNAIPTIIRASVYSSLVKFAISSTETSNTGQMRAATTNGYLAWSAEL
jgi:hypothetical protein